MSLGQRVGTCSDCIELTDYVFGYIRTDEDYDIEPPGVWDGEHTIQQTPHPLGTLSEVSPGLPRHDIWDRTDPEPYSLLYVPSGST